MSLYRLMRHNFAISIILVIGDSVLIKSSSSIIKMNSYYIDNGIVQSIRCYFPSVEVSWIRMSYYYCLDSSGPLDNNIYIIVLLYMWQSQVEKKHYSYQFYTTFQNLQCRFLVMTS